MTEALRDKGFDRLGRRITAPGHTRPGAGELKDLTGKITVKSVPKMDGSGNRTMLNDLTGMIVVKSLPAAVTITYEELKKEMGRAVDGIVKTCSKA